MKKLPVTAVTLLVSSFSNIYAADAPVIECLAPIDGCHIVFLAGEGPIYPTRASSRGIEG